MGTPNDCYDVRNGLADLPLIVEDLLCLIEVHHATSGDPAVIADLWAQVHLLQSR